MNQGTLFGSVPASGAELSDDEVYRYRLWRRWGDGRRTVLFVMLNPSTADASIDDPTIRRCIGFAKREGYAGLDVVNLYALRATDPQKLLEAADPVGPRNDEVIRHAARDAELIICAWGAHPTAPRRARWVYEQIGLSRPGPIGGSAPMVFCLGTTGAGAPRHPLYIPATQPLVEWAPR